MVQRDLLAAFNIRHWTGEPKKYDDAGMRRDYPEFLKRQREAVGQFRKEYGWRRGVVPPPPKEYYEQYEAID